MSKNRTQPQTLNIKKLNTTISDSDWVKGQTKLKKIWTHIKDDTQFKSKQELDALIFYLNELKFFTSLNPSLPIKTILVKIHNDILTDDFDVKLSPEIKNSLKIEIKKILNLIIWEFLGQNENWKKIKQQNVPRLFFLQSTAITVDLEKIPSFNSEITLSNDASVEIEKLYYIPFTEKAIKNNDNLENFTLDSLLTKALIDWKKWNKKHVILKKYLAKLKVSEIETLTFQKKNKNQELEEINFSLKDFYNDEKTKQDLFASSFSSLEGFDFEELEYTIIKEIDNKFEDIKDLFFQYIPKLEVLEIDFFFADNKKIDIKELIALKLNKKPAFLSLLKKEGFSLLSVSALKALMEWIPQKTVNDIKKGLEEAIISKVGDKWKILQLYLEVLHILSIETMPIQSYQNQEIIEFHLYHFFLFNDLELLDLKPVLLEELKKILNSNDQKLEAWLQNTINTKLLKDWQLVQKVFIDLKKNKKKILSIVKNEANETIYVNNLLKYEKTKEAHQLKVQTVQELKKLQGLSFLTLKDLFSGSIDLVPDDKTLLKERLYHFLIPSFMLVLFFAFFLGIFLNRVRNKKKRN